MRVAGAGRSRLAVSGFAFASDIKERLTGRQLKAVLAHELCDVRRRDNLTSMLQMIVEALFWFHPLVWWISARLVDERERACDEEVLRLGNEPIVYAEGILQVCKAYVESPLRCVSGVTGSNLKRRIHAILRQRGAWDLNFMRKAVLAAAGLAALAIPFIAGMTHASLQNETGRLQTPLEFEAVSIKSTKSIEGVKSGCHGIDSKIGPNDMRALRLGGA